MPKRYGVKEKDLVIEHVIDLLLGGKLHSGDRVDRNQIADDLGLSRVPVQEALVQLEHDGLITTQYHRGAFVAQFDAESVREHHEVYGLLSGVASARAALHPTPRVLAELKEYLQNMRGSVDSSTFQENVWAFRRLINHEYAGARLRAAIKASQSFMPRAFWLSYRESQHVSLGFYEDEFQAIRRGDPRRAREICAARSKVIAEVVVSELVRQGVFSPDDDHGTDFPLSLGDLDVGSRSAPVTTDSI